MGLTEANKRPSLTPVNYSLVSIAFLSPARSRIALFNLGPSLILVKRQPHKGAPEGHYFSGALWIRVLDNRDREPFEGIPGPLSLGYETAASGSSSLSSAASSGSAVVVTVVSGAGARARLMIGPSLSVPAFPAYRMM